MRIEEIENEIVDEFALFADDWEQKYAHLIDLGKSLPLVREDEKTDDMLIQGCQSRVWLKTEEENGKIVYRADSDAVITKGMVALLVRVLSKQRPEDIVKADLGFIKTIGLIEHLSPTRANGLVSMVNRMKREAMDKIRQHGQSAH